MSAPELYLNGRQLQLAKRIGRGGEGDVYLLAGDTKKAVKVYKEEKRADREAKVKAMVRLRLAQSTNLVAFPEEVVTTKTGKFVGFTMRLVEGFRELHQLYGPRSRKINYPNADFRFLVRAATNVARAVAQVHSSPCVIGDLNESGLLVSLEARVAVIDADSFQLSADGKVYPCLVGKPEFTAPELHGRSLRGVMRAQAHDNFGLAVAIFQLLFMGRHPYAGQKKGSDLTLEQMIAGNLFAYSKRLNTGVTPPGVLPGLEDFPADIADAFERAFGLEPNRRPSASEWVTLLQKLEGNLRRCGADSTHYYPTTAKQCPWCKMQAATGAMLFVSQVVASGAAAIGLVNFDIEKAWAAIRSISLPDPNTILPKLPAAFRQSPSAEAQSAKGSGWKYKLLGLVVAAVAITCWVNMPGGFLLWVGALFFAFTQFGRSDVNSFEWQKRYSEIDSEWDYNITQWRKSLGVVEAAKLRNNLEADANDYRGLSEEKAKAIARLNTERRDRQMHDYLDNFLIRRATISGIGHARTTMLASYGIESAADIKNHAILNIPGFGQATADKLMNWRRKLGGKFVYNPAPNQSDVAARAKIESEFSNRAATLARKISCGLVELNQLTHILRNKLQVEDRRLADLAQRRAQMEADLEHLGVSKPYKPPGTLVYTPPVVSRTPVHTTTTSRSGVQCPVCGSSMVRRTASRGYRRGSHFWGCTRYPSCKGTRP